MSFELIIVTPQGEAYRGNIERVVLPGQEGEFGVLAKHEKFLSTLRVGEVEITLPDEMLYAAIADGFAEVSGERVTVLVDSCELEHEIDAARADAALTRAQQALQQVAGEDDPRRYRDYEAALERAHTRISVSRKKSR